MMKKHGNIYREKGYYWILLGFHLLKEIIHIEVDFFVWQVVKLGCCKCLKVKNGILLNITTLVK